MSADRLAELIRELDAAREDLSAALAQADPALLTTPGLVGEWSARELVAHLAHWDDWASTCLEAVTDGGLEALASDTWDVDAQNAAVAQRVASLSMEAVRDEEAAAYERFAGLLADLDPSDLAIPAPWGGTVETIVVENGPGHYAEHAEEIRSWFAATDGDLDEEDEEEAPSPAPGR
jgi:hypothetical protein